MHEHIAIDADLLDKAIDQRTLIWSAGIGIAHGNHRDEQFSIYALEHSQVNCEQFPIGGERAHGGAIEQQVLASALALSALLASTLASALALSALLASTLAIILAIILMSTLVSTLVSALVSVLAIILMSTLVSALVCCGPGFQLGQVLGAVEAFSFELL